MVAFVVCIRTLFSILLLDQLVQKHRTSHTVETFRKGLPCFHFFRTRHDRAWVNDNAHVIRAVIGGTNPIEWEGYRLVGVAGVD